MKGRREDEGGRGIHIGGRSQRELTGVKEEESRVGEQRFVC